MWQIWTLEWIQWFYNFWGKCEITSDSDLRWTWTQPLMIKTFVGPNSRFPCGTNVWSVGWSCLSCKRTKKGHCLTIDEQMVTAWSICYSSWYFYCWHSILEPFYELLLRVVTLHSGRAFKLQFKQSNCMLHLSSCFFSFFFFLVFFPLWITLSACGSVMIWT